ncbi:MULTISPECIES: TetR/AcrR family transcriptional regulator [unclassified Janthinobacterium]|uniref:TetR/AcrR family transcriptional regulator n=1 Tax=unclassified Janthinobacterium TaxID=2610881 RepID=UPI001614893A|nr:MULTISPECIES: TetR/AcrR family transcriptional regulator [unclassified Janthinobacterium]MBB5366925.1 AcrR family transcriptional regulator [Janthinobacterium sp. K2C7]MBB5380597.1 AcrR family transcriptional regulator [Janthinobacterium sp. K2Li3]MBB5385307.1 AcrR family transcriptional regulator [Janthinobacterium sp. K2E3]
MSSDPNATSKNARRTPQQQRGALRMQTMLAAAAEVIGEAGYDAATMTEIAARSASSIGAVYQYFPNKDAIVRALRAQYGDEMERLWDGLIAEADQLSVLELSERIIDLMVGFATERPAYFAVLNASLNYRRDADARHRLRERFGRAFQQKQPALSDEQALRLANVALQVVKSLNPLLSQADVAERAQLVAEFKLVLSGYLSSRLSLD